MAHLACIGSHAVNGVSTLHSELLKTDVMRDFLQTTTGEICKHHQRGYATQMAETLQCRTIPFDQRKNWRKDGLQKWKMSL
jgi:glucan phosphorylase